MIEPTEPPPELTDEVRQRRAHWVTALVDGGYRQAHGALRVDDGAGPAFCCLGVAEEVLGARWRPTAPSVGVGFAARVGTHELLDEGQISTGTALTQRACQLLGLVSVNPSVVVRDLDRGDGWVVETLAELNDTWRLSLTEIAAVLADQPADWTGDANAAQSEADARDDRDGVNADEKDAR